MMVRTADMPATEQWNDLFQAMEFAERRFQTWADEGVLSRRWAEDYQARNRDRRQKMEAAQKAQQDVPLKLGLPPGHAGEQAAARSLRYWIFLENELRRYADKGLLPLARAHDLLAEVRERQAALERRLNPDDLPEVELVEVTEEDEVKQIKSSPSRSASPPKPRRPVLEILLDPRNIQMLLAFGGALMVLGLVILLYINEFFTPPLVAIGLGIGNAALLGCGWWVLRSTRYQIAGRALTLLACLVMPLNLWYYHANNLITLDQHLWLAALVISVLYAVSAMVLRDELFVYVFTAGVTMTGLLVLADLPPSPERFWEIALPSSLLVVLGLLAIHVERAFPDQEGPFSRKRFGLAFFWSGHALLAAGLLLVLGAQIAGDWLYKPVFADLYRQMKATPSPIVGEMSWLPLLLVIAGTYAYAYSDLVVRHVGFYIHIAAATVVWGLMLAMQLLNIAMGMDALIAVLALASLLVNAMQITPLQGSRYARGFPLVGLLLPLLAMTLGLLVFVRALTLTSVWPVEPPSWSYVGAMLLTALACRLGAYQYRQTQPKLSAVYFFATAAATLIAATACLAALGLERWQEHAPWLMLVPIAYVIAARLYRGRSPEQPLLWVSHTATAVMLVSSLASAVRGFVLVEGDPLNLVLALFFLEAAVFYALATLFNRRAWTVHLGTAMASASLWQLLTYFNVNPEVYTLTFAGVGLVLLLTYRFAILERFASSPVVDAAFQGANTLLSLAFVAAVFLGLTKLAAHQIQWSLVSVFVALTVIGLLALVLVKHEAWRRWYVVMTIGQGGLTFLGVTVLSTLSLWQKMEIFSVAVGLLLLVVGHLGWYREQERQSDMVSLGLLLGSLLVGVPLALAAMIDRSRDHFILLNELGFFVAALVLLTTGFLFQLRTTTLVGGGLMALYFLTLLIFIPWSRMNAIALFITCGGGTLFVVGLFLSVYRERLLTLPERVRTRQGVYRVLNWR